MNQKTAASMETITNLASNAATTASKLIYGDQTKTDETVQQTKNNETAGKEPISGEQGMGTADQPFDQGNAATPLATADKGTFLDYTGNQTASKEPVSGQVGKGTATEPFDQGNDSKATEQASDETSNSNDFLKLDPVTKGPTETETDTKTESKGEPKIYSDSQDPSYAGMPIVPLTDAATSNTGATSSATTTTAITDKAGVTDKLWKDTPLDDISRSGAPGAGPAGPTDVTPAVPDSAATTTSTDATIKTEAEKESDNRDTPEWTSTGVPSDNSNYEAAAARQNAASSGESKGLTEPAVGRKSESTELASSPSNEEKGSKMSHLKEKMKTKLHIGKDK
ncbi:glycine-rich cell wall structural 1 [Pyrenophora seminiperda CCB06]|uniref:Glycine-rich cell wall structural 1 n=1 Tax=Pyrenophora seminiperda CCB06 TaxID=1302712 RepID=A0A3M7M835_9PLEO|nr:glycine-rich cell wall structural 1 [Pyrenophora seminiperda CCB06]